MKEFIYPEMMVHVPVCTSKEAKDILIISDSSQLLEIEAQRHNESNIKIIKCDLDEISAQDDDSYDVIISEMTNDAAFLSHINRVLKDDGQFKIGRASCRERV